MVAPGHSGTAAATADESCSTPISLSGPGQRTVTIDDRLREALATDPSGAYPVSDDATQTLWLSRLKAIARSAGADAEAAVVQAWLLAHSATTDIERVLGYWLVGAGRPRLENALGVRATHFSRIAEQYPALTYVAGTVVGGSAFVVMVIAVLGGGWASALIGFLLTPGATLFAATLTQRLLGRIHPPIAPASLRIELSCWEIQVLIPVLVTCRADVDAWVETVRVNQQSNKDAHATYWLLSDFGPAESELTADDNDLINRIDAALSELQRSGVDCRWFHQKRRYQAPDDWRPWERKRGKIVEWFAAHASPDRDRFSSIVVLDVDSVVRSDGLRKLAAIAAHPLNRRPNAQPFLQPDVRPLEARETRFAAWFYPPSPTDEVLSLPSFWQDVMGMGMFFGKGRIDGDAVGLAAAAISDNTVLSHDHLEGLLLGAISTNSVVLRESVPPDWPSWAIRQHRWIRGDIQLLGWIWRGTDVDSVNPVRLSALARWRLAENLLLHFSPVATLAALVTSLCLLDGAPTVSVACLCLALLFPADLINGLEMLLPRDGKLFPERVALEGTRWRYRAKATVLELIMLPYAAANAIHAGACSLWRMTVTRNNMLEWRTFAQAVRSSGAVGSHLRTMRPGFILVAGMLALIAGLGSQWAALVLAALWLSAPFVLLVLGARPSNRP